MYGVEVFYDDAINYVYPEAYMAAVAEAGIEPVAPADVEVKEIGKPSKSTVAVSPFCAGRSSTVKVLAYLSWRFFSSVSKSASERWWM